MIKYVRTSLVSSFRHTSVQPGYDVKYCNRQKRRNNMYSPFGSIYRDLKYTSTNHSTQTRAKCAKLFPTKQHYTISKINRFADINICFVRFTSFLSVPSSLYSRSSQTFYVHFLIPIESRWLYGRLICCIVFINNRTDSNLATSDVGSRRNSY